MFVYFLKLILHGKTNYNVNRLVFFNVIYYILLHVGILCFVYDCGCQLICMVKGNIWCHVLSRMNIIELQYFSRGWGVVGMLALKKKKT